MTGATKRQVVDAKALPGVGETATTIWLTVLEGRLSSFVLRVPAEE